MRADQVADAEGDVIQTCGAEGFLVILCPESREGCQDNVNKTIEICQVYSDDLNDRLGSEEDGGADERFPYNVEDCVVIVLPFGVEPSVAGSYAGSPGLEG